MPLINEVVIPMGAQGLLEHPAARRRQPVRQVRGEPGTGRPAAGALPGRVPEPGGAEQVQEAPSADLEAILLTGIPSGVVPDFTNFTGPVQADMLRLNTSIPPSNNPNILGLLGGDLAGFPNGRRVFDDVVSVELRAIAGATYPLIDPKFTPDAAAGELSDGLTPSSLGMPFLDAFPYLGVPFDGYDDPSS